MMSARPGMPTTGYPSAGITNPQTGFSGTSMYSGYGGMQPGMSQMSGGMQPGVPQMSGGMQSGMPQMSGGMQPQTGFLSAARPLSTFTQPGMMSTGMQGMSGFTQPGMTTAQPTGFTGVNPSFSMTPQPQMTSPTIGYPSGFSGMAQPGAPKPFNPMSGMMTSPMTMASSASGAPGTMGTKYQTTQMRDGTETTTASSIFAIPTLAYKSVEEARYEDYKARSGAPASSFAPQSNPMQPMSAASTTFSTASQPFMQTQAPQAFTSALKPSTQFAQPQGPQFSAYSAQPASTFQTGAPSMFSQPGAPSMFSQPGSLSMYSQPGATSMMTSPGKPAGMQPTQPSTLFSTQPSTMGGTQPLSLFGPQANPMAPQSSFMAAQTSPQPGSMFTMQPGMSMTRPATTGPSLFQTSAPQTSSLFQPTASTSMFGPSSMTPQTSMFTSGQPSMFSPSQAPGTQPLLSPSAPSLFSQSATPSAYDQSQMMTSAYRDTHGLSWLYPTSNIDELLSKSGQTPIVSTSENSSIIERALKSQRTGVKAPIDNWRDRSDLKFAAPKRALNLLDVRNSPRKAEPNLLSKRESFSNVKFEPFSSRDDTKYIIRNPASPTKEAHERRTSEKEIYDKETYGLIEIDVVAYDPEHINVMLTVPKTTLVSQVIEKVASRISSVTADELQLVFRNKVLHAEATLIEAGVRNQDTLDLVMIEIPKKRPFELVPTELLPKLTTTGYSLKPSNIELARMSLDQLKSVPNFTVQNQNGKIEFQGTTDVSKLDIDQIVQIEANSVCVYPDSSDSEKPKVGHGLNKPAKVTLFNCKPKKAIPPEEFLQKIKKYCNDHDCEFVSYNGNSGTWEFKVKHF